MIRMWENLESGEKGLPSETSGERGEGGKENPLPHSTGNDRGEGVICEGPLLTVLLNKMETLLDQVLGVCRDFLCMVAYCIAGKFGGELNLAVWRSIIQPPN